MRWVVRYVRWVGEGCQLSHIKNLGQDIELEKARHKLVRVHYTIGDVTGGRCRRGPARRHPPIVCQTREGRDRYAWMGLCCLECSGERLEGMRYSSSH